MPWSSEPVANIGAGGGAGADEVAIGTTDPGPTFELWYDTDAPAVALTSAVPGELYAFTIDTNELYRIIVFSNGTCRAIPIDAGTPAIPTGLAAVPRINSVKLTWAVVPGATEYFIYRDGAERASVNGLVYRDGGVVVGSTFSYNVVAGNAYGLRSDHSSNVTAFIDPALNVAPTVEVTTYPSGTVPLGHKVLVRVNAADLDAQSLATTLGTDVGDLVATADPTVWILEPE